MLHQVAPDNELRLTKAQARELAGYLLMAAALIEAADVIDLRGNRQ